VNILCGPTRPLRTRDNVLWKEVGCATELDYTEQTSWLLFLRYLDGLEQHKADEAKLEGKKYSFILDKPYLSCASPRPPNGFAPSYTADFGGKG